MSSSNIAWSGYQNTHGGGSWDAFLVKFSSSGARKWATYYGGSWVDYGQSCSADHLGNVYLAGFSSSSSGIASSGHQNTLGSTNVHDGFLAKFGDSVNPLPVKLLDFSASYNRKYKQVDLLWKTASEVNNKHFTLERSPDGVNWEELARVTSAGNSNSESNYKHTDAYPYNGKSYYRLKQTDINGSYEYAPVRIVYVENISTVKIHPNPANNMVYIDAPGEAAIEIYSVTGVLMDKLRARQHHAVDVSGYAAGVYLVKVQNTTLKFVKQ